MGRVSDESLPLIDPYDVALVGWGWKVVDGGVCLFVDGTPYSLVFPRGSALECAPDGTFNIRDVQFNGHEPTSAVPENGSPG